MRCQAYYREKDPAAVFLVSMLWHAIDGDLQNATTPARFQDLLGMFLRGSFDKDLAAQVLLKNEQFDVRHLSFMQSHTEVEQVSQDVNVPSMEYKLFSVKLLTEQNMWAQHLAQLHEWESKTHQAQHEYFQTVHDLRTTAVDSHSSTCFPVIACGAVTEAAACAQVVYTLSVALVGISSPTL